MEQGRGREGKCSAVVIRRIGRTNYEWDRMPCRRPAKFIADGQEFCWQHKPNAAEAVAYTLQDQTGGKGRLMNSEEVGRRYGHGPGWARHCKELRSIARKVGKFLMWREDELELLETAQRREDRERAKVAEQERLEAKYPFKIVNGGNN